jgi:hypothetical protein
MVESMIRYSKSGLSNNALKMRSQTPFFAQRRKRWKTLFQWPNAGGRSRRTRTRDPQHSVNKQPIVLAMTALVAVLAWNKMLDSPPLRVRQFSPNQDRPPQLRS